MKKEFNPNLKTPLDQYSKEELNKLASNSMRGNLHSEIRSFENKDVSWESEQIAKSYGIYMQFNRAKTGSEKDWMYMIRVTIPGGGPISPEVWAELDDISTKYTVSSIDGFPSLRLTTRQSVQFHWVKKENVVTVVQKLAESGLKTLNGCGDNVRNVMACPLSSTSDLFDAGLWATRIAAHFELPLSPFIQIFEIDRSDLDPDINQTEKFTYGGALLNRKFKIAVGSVYRNEDGEIVGDNCVETRTNDLSVVPVFENEKLNGFQIYLGGGQGEKNGKKTMSCLAKPFAFVPEDKLLSVMNAIVSVHQEWGDRENRHWARIKYVVKKMGIDWFRRQVESHVGFDLAAPLAHHDVGARCLHHGWSSQENGELSYGAFIENGRLSDASPNGELKKAVKEVSLKFNTPLVITPNQDILFTGIPAHAKDEFIKALESFGYGKRNNSAYSNLRKRSGSCVGKDTCRLAYTDSEKFEPELLDQLEVRGWGHLNTSIGITGCERQCFRPATKAIGLVGSGLNRYQLKLMGTEDGRHQGVPVISENGKDMYLRMIPREDVVEVIDSLFEFFVEERLESEDDPGYFFRRVGVSRIIAYLSRNEKTSHLMEKVDPTWCVLNSQIEIHELNYKNEKFNKDDSVVEYIESFRRGENLASNS